MNDIYTIFYRKHGFPYTKNAVLILLDLIQSKDVKIYEREITSPTNFNVIDLLCISFHTNQECQIQHFQ